MCDQVVQWGSLHLCHPSSSPSCLKSDNPCVLTTSYVFNSLHTYNLISTNTYMLNTSVKAIHQYAFHVIVLPGPCCCATAGFPWQPTYKCWHSNEDVVASNTWRFENRQESFRKFMSSTIFIFVLEQEYLESAQFQTAFSIGKEKHIVWSSLCRCWQ